VRISPSYTNHPTPRDGINADRASAGRSHDRAVEESGRERSVRQLDESDRPISFGDFLKRENLKAIGVHEVRRGQQHDRPVRSNDVDAKYGAQLIGDVFKGEPTLRIAPETQVGYDQHGEGILASGLSGFRARLIDVIG